MAGLSACIRDAAVADRAVLVELDSGFEAPLAALRAVNLAHPECDGYKVSATRAIGYVLLRSWPPMRCLDVDPDYRSLGRACSDIVRPH